MYSFKPHKGRERHQEIIYIRKNGVGKVETYLEEGGGEGDEEGGGSPEEGAESNDVGAVVAGG